MLIKCYFAIIVMVDSIYFASSRNSFKFLSAFGIVHQVLLQHFDYSNHATIFPAQVWGGIHETFISAFSCALYIYVCACIPFWLISFYLWLVLVFLFSKVYYGFTPLRHRTSWNYTSQQIWLTCNYILQYIFLKNGTSLIEQNVILDINQTWSDEFYFIFSFLQAKGKSTHKQLGTMGWLQDRVTHF